MKELNWTLRHRRVVIFGSILYIICSLLACDGKSSPPSEVLHENSIPVEKQQQEADTPDDNAQEADEITADELGAYREELKNISTDELIAKVRSDASHIKASAKALARHLADNEKEEADEIIIDLQKYLEKSVVLVNVITLRELAEEFSQEQNSTMKNVISEIMEALDLAEEVNNMAMKITKEK